MGWKTETTIRQFAICDVCKTEEESTFMLKKDAEKSFRYNGWSFLKKWVTLPDTKQMVKTICPKCRDKLPKATPNNGWF